MARYRLDTGILLHLVRQSKLAGRIMDDINLLDKDNIVLISVVTQAEIESLALKLNWGSNKVILMRRLLDRLIILNINSGDKKLIDSYAKIDAYSQGKLPNKKQRSSSRTMGKNDLWIAATTSLANADLITTDHDFDHLNGVYFKVLLY